MMNRRLRSALVAAAAVASVGAAALPNGTAAASVAKAPAQVRAYDTHLLAHSNIARTNYHAPDYTMNHKLWKIAHAWAKHLSKTGVLEHNPNLSGQISKKCPSWTAIGENVGVVYGTSPETLFEAYMNSPEHRANILDKKFRQVGIATVKVTVNGQLQQWDVMDFGNHC